MALIASDCDAGTLMGQGESPWLPFTALGWFNSPFEYAHESVGDMVRHCLCLAFPLLSWLRHCLCLAFPLPSWLRHCLCLVCSSAVVAKTLPLPCVSTAVVAKTAPFLADSPRAWSQRTSTCSWPAAGASPRVRRATGRCPTRWPLLVAFFIGTRLPPCSECRSSGAKYACCTGTTRPVFSEK